MREFASRRLLVADDEPMVVDTVVRMLKAQLGCHIASASNGAEVLDALQKDRYDLVLTDMLMPGLHGVELIREIVDTAPDCAVIVMTAHPDEFPFVKVVQAGAADFIVKPYQPAELEAKIVRVFKETQLRAELAKDKERILQDMNEMERARAAQALAEVKYHSLFELSMNGMVLTERDTYKIQDVNDAFRELSGRSKEEVLSLTLFDLIDPYEKGRFQQGLTLLSEGGRGTLSDMVLVQPSGRQVYLDVSVTFITVSDESMVLFAFKDVTEQRTLQLQLTDIAQRDSLTGLLNRRTFHARLDAAISRARRTSEHVMLMFIDLDDFKRCNDTYGHQMGDALLSQVGALIQKQVRGGTDESFRYGGDEFAILLPGVSAETAAKIGERLRGEFATGERYGTTMSIGVAEYHDNMNKEAFIQAADNALYGAKDDGKNVVHVAKST